ncbi:hypothetical protein SAMN02744778_00091 [Pantoea sp. GL120224-02]|nr:hypothetical protein SAMN02744778_00091 [Pantoea sp. GL120224-02]
MKRCEVTYSDNSSRLNSIYTVTLARQQQFKNLGG